jgi:hypothetical protein
MYKVISVFHDIKDLKHIYLVGDEFVSDDKERIDNLIARGLIEGERTPSTDSLTKKELIELLKEKGIEFDEKQTKAEMIELLKG